MASPFGLFFELCIVFSKGATGVYTAERDTFRMARNALGYG
jgi:hypothetical protein